MVHGPVGLTGQNVPQVVEMEFKKDQETVIIQLPCMEESLA